MPLIRNDGLVENDRWRRLGDEEPVPDAATPVIVGLARWTAERAALSSRNGPVGVVLTAGEAVEEIADDLGRLALVALDFPKFADGRAYSSARLLRERYGFAGELRAVGDVLRDQLLFMHRCGFDSYEIASDQAPKEWSRALAEFSVWYQPTADGRPPAARLRDRREPRAGAATRAPAMAARAATACCAGDWAY